MIDRKDFERRLIDFNHDGAKIDPIYHRAIVDYVLNGDAPAGLVKAATSKNGKLAMHELAQGRLIRLFFDKEGLIC